ncbi:hypothetical protein BGZ63DRAFT_500188 [Mariannaea sp. PMI_226]|nr:hypothetical protein BGZ63DRAFT_500188 [Mariannaea sp. PMI_226]
MHVPRTTPIIVGVGELRNKHAELSDDAEPAVLISRAVRLALEDASISEKDLMGVDSISIVPPWTWAYPNLPELIAEKLKAKPNHLITGYHGGNQPAALCDEAARRIAVGESRLAIVAGGEALASLARFQKAGKLPPPGWSKPDPAAKVISPSDLSLLGENVGTRHSLGLPIHIYPMYENALRARSQQTQQENNRESAELYAEFDKIARAQPYSWRFGEASRDANAIGTVTKDNRMICTPYPLLMNAFNSVNLAAACIITSVEHAEHLRIPQDKWIYVLGGAGTSVHDNVWERPNFHSSPSLEQSIDAALASSQLSAEDIDAFDFYSCFPIVPKLACKHLGLSLTRPTKPISLLGGLTSFGGAGNNYSMHAITEMVRQLRKHTYRNGLVLANGGSLTHHHSLCLSWQPRKGSEGYARRNPLPQLTEDLFVPPIDEQADGPASIETYTVEYDRKGNPKVAYIIGRISQTGHRFVANHGDAATMQKLVDPDLEPIGLSGIVHQSRDGRNLFYLKSEAKL